MVHVSRSKVLGGSLCVCARFFLFLNIFLERGGYLLYREWCLDIYIFCLHHFLKINMKLLSVSCFGAWMRDMGTPLAIASVPKLFFGSRTEPEVLKNLYLLETWSGVIQGINWVRARTHVLPSALRLMAGCHLIRSLETENHPSACVCVKGDIVPKSERSQGQMSQESCLGINYIGLGVGMPEKKQTIFVSWMNFSMSLWSSYLSY